MSKMLHTKALVEKQSVSEAGVIDAVIGSSEVLDRMGDIILQDGWNLKNYLSNPVILWGHNVGEERPPIAKALKVWVEDKGKKTARLMFKIQFDLQDSFAADIFRKVKEGFVNTVSVGFMPTEWEELDPDNWFGGLKYLKQELLELSFVPVPANPEALVSLRSFASTDKRFTPVEEKDLFPQVQDNRYKKMLKESKEVTLEQVKEIKDSEYVTELKKIEEFDETSFRAMPLTKGEKEYVVIVGKLKDTDAYIEQSFHYAKDIWTEEEIKTESTKEEETPVIDTPEHNEDKGAEVEKADATITDDSDLKEVTAKQLRGMMNEVWKDGYEAGDESDDEKGMMMPEDDMKVKDMKVGQCKALMADCFETMKPSEGKALDKAEIKSMIDAVEKAGRVLSSKNEKKVRQALELLTQVLDELEKEEIQSDATEDSPKANEDAVEKEVVAGVIEYKDLGRVPESENWDGVGEVAKAEIADLQEMCAWFDSEKSEDKSSYKLAHHKAEEGHPAVWRGVTGAMATLLGAKGGIDLTDEALEGVYNHLVKHYEEFGKKAPEFDAVKNKILAGYDEEIQALTLDREEKHVVKLIKKVLENQKKKEVAEPTNAQTIEALKVLNLALSKVDLKKGGQ